LEQFIKLSARYAKSVLVGLLVVTAAFSWALKDLTVDISAEGMMLNDGPERAFYEQVTSSFGADTNVIIFVEDDDLFKPKKLEKLADLVRDLGGLGFVSDTQSLFTLTNLETSGGFLKTSAYLSVIPENEQTAYAIRDRALRNPFVRKNLLSDDGRAMAINVHIYEGKDKPGYEEQLTGQIQKLLDPLSADFKHIYQIGSPYVRTQVTEQIQHDQEFILPASVLALLLGLLVALRRVSAVLLPILTAGFSVIWVLGFMALTGIPVNVMTSIVPALLIIIGSTEDVHLLSEYNQSSEKSVVGAIGQMARRMSVAILLTFITSYLGFLSIAVNSIELLQQFGVVASTGLLFNFIITSSLIPASLKLFSRRNHTISCNHSENAYQRLMGSIYRFVSRHRVSTTIVLLLISLLSIVSAVSLQVNNNIMDYFDEQSDIRKRADYLKQRIAGMETLSVVLNSGIENTFLQLRYLGEIEEIQDYIKQSGDFDASFSFVDYLNMMNSEMDPDVEGEMILPEDDNIVREYSMFIKHSGVRQYINADFSQTQIIVRHNLASSLHLKQAVEKLQQFIDKQTDPGLEAGITGESILTSQAADSMAVGQAKSLLLMTVVIITIISVLFLNLKIGLLAIVPNLFPVIVLFGVMGFLQIPLDTGTAMIAAIAIGICVDDTMHFMARYNRQLRDVDDEEKAILKTIKKEATPITATSLALMLGFGVLALSSFRPVVHFGWLSAMVMMLALIADFIITPLMLSSVRLVTMWDVLSLRLRQRLLDECPLFRDMRRWEIKKLILASDVRDYRAGEVIIKRGDIGKEMFVILDGMAITHLPDGESTYLDVGSVFGEVALVSDVTRTADVMAKTDTQVLSLDMIVVRRISRMYPRTSLKFYMNVSAVLGRRFAPIMSQ